MSGKRHTEEFKAEAVNKVTERGHPVAEVASRDGYNRHLSPVDYEKQYFERLASA